MRKVIKKCEKVLTNAERYAIIKAQKIWPPGQAAKTSPSHGENGSSILPGVTSRWPVGQAVKTRPFHGCNMGSIPVRVTTKARYVLTKRPYLVFLRTKTGIEGRGLSGQSGGLFAPRHRSARRRAIPVRVTKKSGVHTQYVLRSFFGFHLTKTDNRHLFAGACYLSSLCVRPNSKVRQFLTFSRARLSTLLNCSIKVRSSAVRKEGIAFCRPSR